MKAMLVQPMAGKTDEEINETKQRAVVELTNNGYEIVNTLFTTEWHSPEKMKERGVVQIPLGFLAKSLEIMSQCHAVYFCDGWEKTRGCVIEHAAAKAYGLIIMYEHPAEEAATPENIVEDHQTCKCCNFLKQIHCYK